MARWERARDALPTRLNAPVLDLGCAFGYGTAKLAARHRVVGMDASAADVRRAQRAHPHIPFVVARGEALPFASESFGALVCLDVLEHVGDDARTLAEIARVCRPNAPIVISVPNEGALAALDSLNLYQRVRRHLRILPAPPEIGDGWHRHYSTQKILALAAHRFAAEREWVTGLGLAELIHLPLLLVLRGLLRWTRLFNVLQYVYFSAYMLEDLLPVPRWGYHLMLRARRVPQAVAP